MNEDAITQGAGTDGAMAKGEVTERAAIEEPTNFPLHVLEDDEDIPPRPEEELADIERSAPDPR